MNKDTFNMLARLRDAGISADDAFALRRIAMTLHRWFELECGTNGPDPNLTDAIERDGNEDDSTPYYIRSGHFKTVNGKSEYKVLRWRIPDRETGARKRLAKIMAKYPDLWAYVQTDCRGAPLYIGQYNPATKGADPHLFYNSGIAVFK